MRTLAPLVLVLAAAVCAAGAHADTFAVVTPSSLSGIPLPSAAIPNLPGSVAFPRELSARPVAPAVLSSGQLLALWHSAGAAYGIPWQVLGAINKVESNFGGNMGPSSAGAIGWMQFMPSTWTEWGVDANGDGVADPWNPDDAVYSAARYLAAAGGASDIRRAVFAYNHAGWYVDEVLGLANVYGSGAAAVLSLDRLQTNLDSARNAVADASDRLVAAEGRARGLGGELARATRRAAAESLLSTRLELEQRAGLVRARLHAAQADVRYARAGVAKASDALDRARSAATPVSFSGGAASLLGAPSYASGWVFPVGGGPSLVSVGHTHHDYPAADIAAPAGSPVYALSQGVVVRSWTQPDPKCGIGLIFDSADGQEWTYCHLAYLEPTVVSGAALAAGAPVGLVGSTGDATGPHLHLQLDPPQSYPQAEPWFAAFAGVAFTWQDAAPSDQQQPTLRFLSVAHTATAPAAHVFAVVPKSSVVLFSRP